MGRSPEKRECVKAVITPPNKGAIKLSNCDCRKNIEAKLLERFKASAPDATDHQAELKGYCMGLTENTIITRPFMPFKVTATHPLKKGGTKSKSATQNMMFNYCPFCGTPEGGDA